MPIEGGTALHGVNCVKIPALYIRNRYSNLAANIHTQARLSKGPFLSVAHTSEVMMKKSGSGTPSRTTLSVKTSLMRIQQMLASPLPEPRVFRGQ
jgi:hypothetical protein